MRRWGRFLISQVGMEKRHAGFPPGYVAPMTQVVGQGNCSLLLQGGEERRLVPVDCKGEKLIDATERELWVYSTHRRYGDLLEGFWCEIFIFPGKRKVFLLLPLHFLDGSQRRGSQILQAACRATSRTGRQTEDPDTSMDCLQCLPGRATKCVDFENRSTMVKITVLPSEEGKAVTQPREIWDQEHQRTGSGLSNASQRAAGNLLWAQKK